MRLRLFLCKHVTHKLRLLVAHKQQWLRLDGTSRPGSFPVSLFVNTGLTLNCVFQHETADLVRPVTVSGVHACETAVRCRAVSWRWARCQGSEDIIGAEEAANPADTWGRVSAHLQRMTRNASDGDGRGLGGEVGATEAKLQKQPQLTGTQTSTGFHGF